MNAIAVVIACLACAVAVTAAPWRPDDQGPPQSRDTIRQPPSAAKTGTGGISGVVVAAGTDAAPLRRAIVMVTEQAAGSSHAVVTDDQGRFTFEALTAGRYLVTATKAAYLPTAYGMTRPRRTGGAPTGTAIVLADGQKMSDVRLVMTRGGVITGTVRGPNGQPVRGASIGVMYPRRDGTGGTGLGVVSSETTDATGRYRVFGLPPGEYLVAAGMTGPANDLEVTRAADLAVADRLSRSDPGGPPPPAPPSTRPRAGFITMFFPGVASPADASLVTVLPGEEKAGIDIRVDVVANVRLNGRVADAAGRPLAGASLRLLMEATGGVPFSVVTTADAGGAFSFRGVPAGRYRLEASSGSSASVDPPPLWAQTTVSVGNADMDNVQLTLVPAAILSGRVHVRAAAAAPPEMSRLRVVLTQGTGGNRLVALSGDGQFRTPLPPGHYRVSMQIPAPAGRPDWIAERAMLSGTDVLASGFEVAAGVAVPELTIELTDRVPEIAGSLTDAAGRPAPEYFVIVFPADRARWTWGSPGIRQTRPASDGRFLAAGLPPGEYLIGAVTDVEENQWFEPGFLEQLAPASVKVTLGPGQRLVQDLRVR